MNDVDGAGGRSVAVVSKVRTRRGGKMTGQNKKEDAKKAMSWRKFNHGHVTVRELSR